MTTLPRWFIVCLIFSMPILGRADSQSAASQDAKKSVPALIQDLQSEEPDKREHAIQALGVMGPQARQAAPALQKALNDDFPYVRTRAAETLIKIGPTSIPIFIEALKNPNADVRAIAASALGPYGQSANSAIPGLVSALEDIESPVRERAAHSLEQIGPPVVLPLIDFLKTSQGPSTLLALRIVGGVPSDDPTVVPQLMTHWTSADPQVRLAVSKALARQGAAHVPELIEGLQSANADTRALSADVLSDVGRAASSAVPALVDRLKDTAPAVRASAARALGHMGSKATTAAIPPLKVATQDPEASVAARAKEALTNLSAAIEPQEVSVEKQRLLTSRDEVHDSPKRALPVKKASPQIIKPAVKPLGKKSKNKPSIAQLIALLRSPENSVRQGAVKSIVEWGAPALPALTRALLDGTTTVRQNAGQAFIQIDSTVAVQALTTVSKEGDLNTRLDALANLQSMGVQAKSAVPALLLLLVDPSPAIQAAADAALDHIGTEEAKKALEVYRQGQRTKTIAALLKTLRKGGKDADQASAALFKMGNPAVPPLALVLSDPHAENRLSAAKVLNRMGSAAAPATAALSDALQDSDAGVRHLCANTLEKINSPDAKKALRFFPIMDKYYTLLSFFRH